MKLAGTALLVFFIVAALASWSTTGFFATGVTCNDPGGCYYTGIDWQTNVQFGVLVGAAAALVAAGAAIRRRSPDGAGIESVD